MKSSYVDNMLMQIELDERYPNAFYNESKIIDHRGIIRFMAEDFDTLAFVVQEIADRGWRPKIIHDPKDLMIHVDFDCKGEDFEGLQVSMKLKKFHDWCNRYEGREPIPIPELTAPMNELLKEGNVNVVNDIEFVYAAQIMWLRNRDA